MCVLIVVSAVCHRQFSLSVFSDVWRCGPRHSHVYRRAVDGPAREEVYTDEERQRGIL